MDRNEHFGLDRRAQITRAVANLADAFDGQFGADIIEKFVDENFDRIAAKATNTQFIGTLAEAAVRKRLRVLAKLAGPTADGRPCVLFLCVHNAGRSQMALGWLEHLAGDAVIGYSGGSEPAAEINPVVVAAMAEVGIDITGEFPKPWTDDIVRAADVVVLMGCGDACPVYPAKRYIEWTLDDPAGADMARVRRIRDQIRARVEVLLQEFAVG